MLEIQILMKHKLTIILFYLLLAFTSNAQVNRANNKSSVAYRNNYQRVAAGYLHTVEIRKGTLVAYGLNNHGQLGLGDTLSRTTPVQIGTATNWVSVSCGYYHTLAIKADGTLWAWGYNSNGQLGDGSTTQRLSPVQVGTLNTWISVACGANFTEAIKANGTLWAWGDNTAGQLGDNSNTQRTSPVQIGSDSNWTNISCGQVHTLGIRANGTLWAWGDNTYLQCTIIYSNIPAMVGSDSNWTRISAGGTHSLALRANGTLWAWGNGISGQLGDGTNNSSAYPIIIGSDSLWVGIATGQDYSMGLKVNGTLWAWGSNSNGQLGDSTTIDKNSPTQLPVTNNIFWVGMNCGSAHSFGLKSNCSLNVWGKNSNGQLGIGNTLQKISPVQTSMVSNGLSGSGGYAHTEILKSNGKIYSAGYGTSGQLGNNSTSNSSTFDNVYNAVYGFNNYVGVACGDLHTLAIGDDGRIFSWGSNAYGQLGDNSIINRIVPVQVGTSNTWITLSGGYTHSVAIKSNGTLWAWGDNRHGQLGDGTTTAALTPRQIGTEKNWVSISAGYEHCLGLKSNGTLWVWGNNWIGQLGDGTTTEKHAPIQITDLTNCIGAWAKGNRSYAIKSDGSLWAWGAGGLGDSTNVSRISPVRIGNLYNWINISSGGGSMTSAKSDGSLWSWGSNNYGQLGDGTLINKLVPTQITTQSNVIFVTTGTNQSAILKADRSLLCITGYNNYGQLGNGTTTNTNTFGCTYTLPVSLIDFTAQLVSNKTVQLNWSTGSEQNNAGFEVERSVTASNQNLTENWETVGKLKGNGNTSHIIKYQLPDDITAIINSHIPIIYYRLKQVDFDGHHSYSKIVSVNLENLKAADKLTKIYPNPFTNKLIIEPTNAMQNMPFEVYDFTGRKIYEKSISFIAAGSPYEIEMPFLTAGLYFIKLGDEFHSMIKE